MIAQTVIVAEALRPPQTARDGRLRKHADYQRVYKTSRKHFSPSMTFFYALRPGPVIVEAATTRAPNHKPIPPGPRVGLTAGRVLGKAVDRNRIKRRMREVVRKHLAHLTADVDVILHPRKSVREMDFALLDAEVARIFTTIRRALDNPRAAKS